MSIPESMQPFFMFIGLLFTITTCGVAFTFGAVITCRWMAWSPVTVNVIDSRTYTGDGQERPTA